MSTHFNVTIGPDTRPTESFPDKLLKLSRRAVQTDDGHKYLVPAGDLIEYNAALRSAAEAITTLTIERDALRAQRDELSQRVLNDGAATREPAEDLDTIRPLLIEALRAAKLDLPNLEYDFPDMLSVEGDDIEFRLTIGAL